MAEHSINLDHRIQLQNASILAKKSIRMDRIIRIALYADNMNREDGFSLNSSLKPFILALKERKQLSSTTWRSIPFIPLLSVVQMRTFLDSYSPMNFKRPSSQPYPHVVA
jgi:hypothetical protein